MQNQPSLRTFIEHLSHEQIIVLRGASMWHHMNSLVGNRDDAFAQTFSLSCGQCLKAASDTIVYHTVKAKRKMLQGSEHYMIKSTPLKQYPIKQSLTRIAQTLRIILEIHFHSMIFTQPRTQVMRALLFQQLPLIINSYWMILNDRPTQLIANSKTLDLNLQKTQIHML